MRKYSGYTGRKSNGEGIERFTALSLKRWGGTCLGTYSDRDMRGKPGVKSIHADYRATDLRLKDRYNTRRACKWLTRPDVAAGLRIEMVIDYSYRGPLRKAYGRAWRCDRAKWVPLPKGDVVGGGQSWATWIHVEIAPGVLANSGEMMSNAWKRLPYNKGDK